MQFWLRRACNRPDYSLTENSAEANICRTMSWRWLTEVNHVRSLRSCIRAINPRHRFRWAMKHCHGRKQCSWVVCSDGEALRFKDGRLRLWIKPLEKNHERFSTSRRQEDGKNFFMMVAIWNNRPTSTHVIKENMNSKCYWHIEMLSVHLNRLAFSLMVLDGWQYPSKLFYGDSI